MFRLEYKKQESSETYYQLLESHLGNIKSYIIVL